jgi:adenosylmethionine-8-amino-7-oxononanoate aminotransferase
MKKSFALEMDRRHVWHPFTPFDSWLSSRYEILSITRAEGSRLYDQNGRVYLDGNSSIWTNIHGHQCKEINRAIIQQLGKVAHSSFLGLTNELAPLLAGRLVAAANCGDANALSKVIFSDDGSTAIEAAVKVVFQSHQLSKRTKRTKFVCLGGGYHGDTVGAMSVGQSSIFHGAYGSLLFPSTSVQSPYCYRCPHNQAQPQEADARLYRKCKWECVGDLKKTLRSVSGELAGVVMEPLVQGAAGMIMHPEGYLTQVADLTRKQGGWLILDEVMTGFYRTGKLFAHFHEGVRPDALALAKGLTGGYLPLAATLVTEELVTPFYGGVERTFYHGHSYSGNQLGCSAGLANLKLLEKAAFTVRLQKRIAEMSRHAARFWRHPLVGDVRQCGLILGVELVQDRRTKEPFPWKQRVGWQVCEAARKFGLLTRPSGNVLILMPRLNVSSNELRSMMEALEEALYDVFPVAASNPSSR